MTETMMSLFFDDTDESHIFILQMRFDDEFRDFIFRILVKDFNDSFEKILEYDL